LGFERDGATASEGVVQAGHLGGVEQFLRLGVVFVQFA
jgi:hypothetical protein